MLVIGHDGRPGVDMVVSKEAGRGVGATAGLRDA